MATITEVKKSLGFFVKNAILDSNNFKFFEFSYKQGKGNFKVLTEILITRFTITDFKKVASMMESNENPQVIAGYLNSMLKRIYNDMIEVQNSYILKHNGNEDDALNGAMEYIEKRNAILVKLFNVVPVKEVQKTEVQEVQETEVIDTANEIMTDLKRCNVNRLIPTQVNPLWKNCKVETKIGYQFEYRGMPLQVVTDKGWISKDTVCKVFIIDPVIGLPVSSYDGTLAELENKLSEVFINYLKTIESNKEAIVQLATAFNRLTAITKIA